MSLQLFNLKGKTAIVVGATMGLGKGMAKALAGAGADLVIASRNEANLQACAREIREETKANVLPVTFDVCKMQDIDKLVKEAMDEYGHIDILVNSAGMNIRKPVIEVTEQDWEAVMNVQLKGVYFTCQAAAKQMIKQGKGKIINMASLTSVLGLPNISVYGACKGGIVQISKAMAVEWTQYNINVNCIGPGYYKTEMTAPLFNDPEKAQGILRRIPMGRTGVPEDLAGAVIFLASDASDYMTGQVVFVDGGWLAG